MKRTPIRVNPADFPPSFRPLIENNPVFDSSCSPEARVYYIDKEGGLFLKYAPKNTLQTEAQMTAYLHSRNLAPEVLAFESLDRDWLLTSRVPGKDCTHQTYLDDPIRLCDTTASLLHQLHELSADDCPIQNRTESYIATLQRNHNAGRFDLSLFPEGWGFSTPEQAWHAAQNGMDLLKSDTLIHGDYCLPNVMLDNWKFSGFIDVGAGGIGDRHIDLFWGIWSLFYNLKTDRYTDRFLDAYGREKIEPEMLRIIAACEIFG